MSPRTLHILVVDDEVGFARMLGRALRRLGHIPTLASHPTDALSLFSQRSFDAVITDIDMPVMDGIQLARSLRAQRADVPIAFCTGSSPNAERYTVASTFGEVRPKLWRENDVRLLLEAMSLAESNDAN